MILWFSIRLFTSEVMDTAWNWLNSSKLEDQAEEELSKKAIASIKQNGNAAVLKTEDEPVFYDKTGKTTPPATESRFSISV